jgi:hypothetical protein
MLFLSHNIKQSTVAWQKLCNKDEAIKSEQQVGGRRKAKNQIFGNGFRIGFVQIAARRGNA